MHYFKDICGHHYIENRSPGIDHAACSLEDPRNQNFFPVTKTIVPLYSGLFKMQKIRFRAFFVTIYISPVLKDFTKTITW